MPTAKQNRGSMFQNIYKWWCNFGTFEHSKIISLIFLIGYNLFTFFVRYIHDVLDQIPCINNNPNQMNVELRTLHNLLHMQDYIYSLFRINRTQWKGPWNDKQFILLFDALLNYSMSAAVPIPLATNIKKEKLDKNTIKSYLYENKINFTEQQNGKNIKSRDYNQFYIQNVNLIWIYANDKIENKSMNDVIIYIHGGGYSLCGPSHIGYCSRLSLSTNTKILFIDYSKPPNCSIPKQVDEILTAYFYILSQLNNNNNKIVIGGDSAGAGLCCLVLQKLSFLGLSDYHPIGTLLYSPFIDLTLKGSSWKKFANKDMIVAEGFASRSGLLAVGNDEKLLRSPFFSAIYAPDYEIKSNVMLFVSTDECLYDDAKSLLKKLRITDAEYKIVYKEFHYCPHAFVVLHGVIPEANEAMNDIVKNVTKWFHR